MTTGTKRPPRPRITLTVRGSERISSHLHRVTFDAPGFTPNEYTDMYVKLLFVAPQAESSPIPLPVTSSQDDSTPVVRRTYTVRSFDADTSTLTIDFVVHGDEGIAAPWAAACQPGDQILAMGPGGGYAPQLDADWHLFLVDLSALPATVAALESLDDQARGLVVIHSNDQDDQIALSHPKDVEVRWVVADSSEISALCDALDDAPWHLGQVSVFAHGERESIKLVRRALREREIPSDRISISGYWALGRTEDRFQAEKREPIGKI
ncbi:NADPH-dependent ferric siderophore reductase, contains FAD-binding and SIP domains [Micrococcales bacterium KH10]|nr:NADPH-dependent ferric siderophore reductase, contains FAD-binding and SIP domains [Micrococcales bacterium KH10]